MPSSTPSLRPQRRGLLAADEPVYALRPDGPRYGDAVWDFGQLITRESQGERRIHPTTIPVAYRTATLDLLCVLAQPDHPAVVAAGVVRRGDPTPPGTVISQFLRLRVLARWGVKQRLRAFEDWTQTDADRFLDALRTGQHRDEGEALRPSGIRGYVDTLKLLRECGPALAGGGLQFQPWGARSAAAVAGEQRPPENLTAPLGWDTWAPTVAAAWAVVGRFSEEILAAVEAAGRLPPRPAGPAGANAWAVLTAWGRDGGLMPLHTGFGRSPGERGKPNISLLCRMLRINDSIFKPVHHAYRPAATALVENLASDPARSVYGGLITPVVTVTQPDGRSTPWIAEVGLGETEYLESVLRAACYVLLSALTGMRDSEVQALTRTAATTRDGLRALDSRQYKGQNNPEGTPRGWWAPAPVMRVVDVLSQLSEHPTHLLARSASNMGVYDPGRDIPRLVAFVNDDPSTRPGRGHGLGLARIDTSGVSGINALTLRRSFSVYAVTKPGAELGLGIQLGHAAWRTTTAYAVDGQEQAVRRMDAARISLAREQAAALVLGTSPVAGTPAREVLVFRAQIVADPARADRITESVAERLHLGITNDCMFAAATAGCGSDGPHLGDHLCVGPDCSNALFRSIHRAMLVEAVARHDNFLDGGRGGPELRERMGRDRSVLMALIRALDEDQDDPEEED